MLAPDRRVPHYARVIAVLVLLGLVALRLLILGGVAFLLIPAGRRCPACGGETIALERAGWVRMLPGVARRWCMHCGWSWLRKQKAGEPLAPVPRPSMERHVGI